MIMLACSHVVVWLMYMPQSACLPSQDGAWYLQSIVQLSCVVKGLLIVQQILPRCKSRARPCDSIAGVLGNSQVGYEEAGQILRLIQEEEALHTVDEAAHWQLQLDTSTSGSEDFLLERRLHHTTTRCLMCVTSICHAKVCSPVT